MLSLINRSFYLIKRNVHNIKLPSIKISRKKINNHLIERYNEKVDNNINNKIKDLNKSKKLKYEDFIRINRF
jgi:hypothetical protein